MDDPFTRGRAASGGTLLRELRSAPVPYLEGALLNPALTPRHLVLILANPSASTALIARVCRNSAWMKSYAVRAAIALHSGTPPEIGMQIVATLRWRHLLEIVDRVDLKPALRRLAANRLATAIAEAAEGEKISMARSAGRNAIGLLCEDLSPRVTRALLQNPLLLEADLLRAAKDKRTSPSVLRALAEDRKFGPRREIRKAIVAHAATPAALALRLLHELSHRDIEELVRSHPLPRLVKVAAERLLRGVHHQQSGRRSPQDRRH